MAWLLVSIASMWNVNVGTDITSNPFTSYPFFSFTFEHWVVLRLFLRLTQRNSRIPSVVHYCYFDQKPMQTTLAIIQQNVIFTLTALYQLFCWWWGSVCRWRGNWVWDHLPALTESPERRFSMGWHWIKFLFVHLTHTQSPLDICSQ